MSGQQIGKESKGKAMTEAESDELKQKLAVNTHTNKVFIFGKPAALGEEVQTSITLTGKTVFAG